MLNKQITKGSIASSGNLFFFQQTYVVLNHTYKHCRLEKDKLRADFCFHGHMSKSVVYLPVFPSS